MQITEIAVTVSEVNNLGNYSSTKPSVSLKATLAADEIPAQKLDELITLAKTTVHEQIDRERLANGLDPLYFTGDAYDVFYSYSLNLVIVTPTGLYGRRRRSTGGWNRVAMGRPLDNAQDEALKSLQDHDDGSESLPWQLVICVKEEELPTFEATVATRQHAYDDEQARIKAEREEAERKRREEWERQRTTTRDGEQF